MITEGDGAEQTQKWNLGLDGEPPLMKSIAGAVRWSFLASAGKQAIRLLFTLILARLLGPENFGIIAQATIYIAFTSVLGDLGFGSVLIQRRRLEGADIGSVFWLTTGSAGLIALITIFVAPSLARFFNTPELTDVLRALSLSVVVTGLAVTPASLLARKMKFKKIAVAEVISTVLGGAVGVIAAISGAEYWSLVIYTLVYDVCGALLIVLFAGRLSLQWSGRSLRKMWSTSSNILGAQILHYIIRNADNLLVARFLGNVALAHYALAYRVLLLPLQMLGQVVNRIALPTLSRLQDDPVRLRSFVLRAMQGLAFVTFPAMGLIASSAATAVPVFFGSQWRPAVIPIQILAVTAMRQSVQTLYSPILIATDRARWAFRWTIISGVASFVSFVVGLRWGIVGVAASWTITGFILAPVPATVAGRAAQITILDQLRAVAPAATSTLALLGGWQASSLMVDVFEGGELLLLAAGSGVALACYLLSMRLFWHDDLRRSFLMVRMIGWPHRTPTNVSR